MSCELTTGNNPWATPQQTAKKKREEEKGSSRVVYPKRVLSVNAGVDQARMVL